MKKDGYSLYKCPACGLVFVFPQIHNDYLEAKVYSEESGYQANKPTKLDAVVVPPRVVRILDRMKKYVPGKRLLDVGCSNGEFMRAAEKEGFETKGVELNKRTAEIAKKNGLDVYNGFLEDARFQNGLFDVVFLGDLIEHVNDPKAIVRECRRILGQNGSVVISTPNLDCFWSRSTLMLYRLFGIPWSSATPPHHLFQFSFHNLTRLMRDSGFKERSVWYERPPRLMYELGSLHLYKRFKNHPTIGSLFYMLFSFGAYVIFYGLDYVLTPIKSTDFGMVAIYQKNV